MLNKTELKQIARLRLAEAKILNREEKYEGTVHLCVCAIEIALKKKICDALDWNSFPETTGEFEDYKSFRIHHPQILLRLAGQEKKIKKDKSAWANWSILESFQEDIFKIEVRYARRGSVAKPQAREIVDATTQLLKFFKI